MSLLGVCKGYLGASFAKTGIGTVSDDGKELKSAWAPVGHKSVFAGASFNSSVFTVLWLTM